MKKFIQHIKENGYQTDLNLILLKGFTLYKGIFLPSFALLILAVVIIFGLYTSLIYSYFPNIEIAAQELMNFDLNALSQMELMQYFGFNALLNVIIALVNVGIYSFASQYHHEGKIKIGATLKNMFGATGLQIALFTFVLQFGISNASLYLQQMDLTSVSFIITLVIHTLTLLVTPIMISEKVHLFQAIKYSTDIVNIKPFRMLWYLIFAGILSISGMMFFGIGLLFSYPMFYIFLFALYHQIRHQITIN
jgi:hypothetical protein